MNKIKILIGLFIFLALCYSNQAFSGDNWQVTSVKMPKTIGLGGQDWDFKVTVKNGVSFKAAGELSLTVSFACDGKTYEKRFTERHPALEPGETFVLTYANQEVSYISPRNKGIHQMHVEVSLTDAWPQIFSQNYNIKWK
jgi:hypothetical protein